MSAASMSEHLHYGSLFQGIFGRHYAKGTREYCLGEDLMISSSMPRDDISFKVHNIQQLESAEKKAIESISKAFFQEGCFQLPQGFSQLSPEEKSQIQKLVNTGFVE